jgi:hypothetical protein
MTKVKDFSVFTCNFAKDLNEFNRQNYPIEAFPEKLQKIIFRLFKTNNYHPAHQAAGILSAAATIIGNKMAVKDIDVLSGKIIRPNVFFVNVAISGDGKTPSRVFYLNYIFNESKEISLAHTTAVRLMNSFKTIRTGKTAEEQVASKAKREELAAKFNILGLGGDIAHEEPIFYPYDLDATQTTNEFLISKFAEREYALTQPEYRKYQHGILLHSAEIHGLIKSIDRYESNLLTNLNNAWDGGTMSSGTLKGGAKIAAAPPICLSGDLQYNKPLKDFYRAENTNSGFAQRIFAAAPTTRAILVEANRQTETDVKQWAAICKALQNVDMYGTLISTKPCYGKFIPLTKNARSVYLDFSKQVYEKECLINEIFPNAWQKSAIKKGRDSVVRLALLLEMLAFAESAADSEDLGGLLNAKFPVGISSNSMIGALKLFDYYMNTNNYLSNLEQTEMEVLPNSKHRDFFSSLPEKFILPIECEYSPRQQIRIIEQCLAAGMVKKNGRNNYQKL